MSNLLIETKSISYLKKNKFILDNVNLEIEKGSIYGLLGLNGAGKTTLIKILLGLLFVEGTHLKDTYIKLFDREFTQENRYFILSQIGVLIENAALYEHLTAYENLRIVQLMRNLPKSYINESLEIVGLKNEIHQKVKRFSLGMKQRLGIAIAIISKPQLLILDEPTNGLDPQGIIDLRNLILDLNKNSGITFLICSHLLPEIENLATHIGILHQGKLVFQDTLLNIHQKESLEHLFTTITNTNLK